MELAVVGIWIVLFLVDGFRVDFLRVNRERVSGIVRRAFSEKRARFESLAVLFRQKRCAWNRRPRPMNRETVTAAVDDAFSSMTRR
jgi:hypothetical protein